MKILTNVDEKLKSSPEKFVSGEFKKSKPPSSETDNHYNVKVLFIGCSFRHKRVSDHLVTGITEKLRSTQQCTGIFLLWAK